MTVARSLGVAAALALAATLPLPSAAGINANLLSPLAGNWTLERDHGDGSQWDLRLERNLDKGDDHVHWSSSFDVQRDDLPGLSREAWDGKDADVSFDLPRDAGRFHFDGRMHDGRGAGQFAFVPDEAFRRELGRAGYKADDADLARLAIHDVTMDWLQGFAKTGYRFDSIDGIVRFASHAVKPQFVDRLQKLGYTELSDDDIVRLTSHGVDVEYVEQIGALTNPKPNADDLVRLKSHGVDPAYVRGFRELTPSVTADDMVRLASHGVSPDYARAFREAGYKFTPDDFVRLMGHGVSPEFARRARQEHGPLNTDELIRLKERGRL